MNAVGGEVVFNVVWTGRVFDQLQYFVASQMHHSTARFRFIANACPADQIAAMERFAEAHDGRVVEVIDISSEKMVRHGDALDEVLRARDDGEFFSLIDPDIVARKPFLPQFHHLLLSHDAVTSGREVWSDHNVRPAEHPGVNGEYFFDQDGFVFGSPHFAIYRRAALTDTIDRWGVGFSSAGNDLSDAVRERLEEVGRSYWVYDTGKIVNILFQTDDHTLVHSEHPDLMHIGGVSHYLAPPSSAPAARNRPPVWGEGPDWGQHEGMAHRFEVARYTAHLLRELCEGREAPASPEPVEPDLAKRLNAVRTALIELIARYGPQSAHMPAERSR